MWIYILILIVAIILIYLFATYNNLVQLRNKVEEAFSTMNVYLKKRWDLIPNLVETVKGYASHEKETLEEIVNLRNSAYNELSTTEKIDVNNKLSTSLGKLLAIAENYPDLKANTNFLDLSKELSNIENDIANSRKYYNGTVKMLNNKIQMFPSNLIAKLFGFKIATMFEIAEAEKENVKIEF